MNRKSEQVRPPYLRIASPSHVVLQLFHTLVFSPDADVAASNQPRACNRLLVHQRGADGFAVHLPTVLECQFQTPTHFSFGELIDDLLQFGLVEADVPLEEAFWDLEGIVDNQRGVLFRCIPMSLFSPSSFLIPRAIMKANRNPFSLVTRFSAAFFLAAASRPPWN